MKKSLSNNIMDVLKTNLISASGITFSFLMQNVNLLLSAMMIISVIAFNSVKIYQILKQKNSNS